jgi:RNA polymerase sigma factor (sigma-70 family)
VSLPWTASVTLDETVAAAAPAPAPERIARLFDVHQDRLFRLGLRLCSDREEARDLVQETFLRAARQPGAIPRDEPGGEAWLVRTLVNLCRDRWRRLEVRSRAHGELRSEQQSSSESPEAAQIARATVRAALVRLSPRRRAVVVLHEIEDRPVREVARLLGVTEVTVRWHLLAARRELARTLLEGEAS